MTDGQRNPRRNRMLIRPYQLARVTQPIPLVDVKAQYAPLIPELEERFSAVLESGRFIFGPEVAAFEHEAAAYLGVPVEGPYKSDHYRY